MAATWNFQRSRVSPAGPAARSTKTFHHFGGSQRLRRDCRMVAAAL